MNNDRFRNWQNQTSGRHYSSETPEERAWRDGRVIFLIPLGILIILLALLFAACTIAPKVSEPARPSPWAQANIRGYDATGIFVGRDWLRVYRGLLAKYGDKLPIAEQASAHDMTGIELRGGLYHVTFAVNKRMTDLKFLENAEAGP